MTLEEANILLNNFGSCWMEENEDIVYIAVVEDKIKSTEFSLEMGIENKNGKMKVKQIGSRDIPLSCKLDNQKSDTLKISDSLRNEINKTQSIKSTTKEVDKVSLQHISNHKIRPLLSGSCIESVSGPNTKGTLGAFVVIEPFPDKIFILTNHHVLINSRSSKNDLVFQPDNGTNDYSNAIGRVKFGHFGKTANDTWLDVAFVELIRHKHWDQLRNLINAGFIWDDSNLDVNSPSLKGIKLPKCNDTIKIHGRTSGLSTGKVISNNAFVRINITSGNTKVTSKKTKSQIFKNQILTENISRNGDSGSVLVDNENNVVGLLFAGDEKHISVANNIEHIFNNHYLIDHNTKPIKFLNFLT